MSKRTTQSLRRALTAAAAIAFAIALHPVKANAQGGGAPTDPQIVGIVTAADQIDINYAKLALSGHLQHAERVQSAIEGQASRAM